jgi:hypothetical protein
MDPKHILDFFKHILICIMVWRLGFEISSAYIHTIMLNKGYEQTVKENEIVWVKNVSTE